MTTTSFIYVCGPGLDDLPVQAAEPSTKRQGQARAVELKNVNGEKRLILQPPADVDPFRRAPGVARGWLAAAVRMETEEVRSDGATGAAAR